MTLFEFTLSSEIIKNLSYDVVFQMEKYGQDIALRMISGQGRNTEPSKLPLREAPRQPALRPLWINELALELLSLGVTKEASQTQLL